MAPTHGPYILQFCMGPSYFWRGLTPPDPPLFRTLVGWRSMAPDSNSSWLNHHYVNSLAPTVAIWVQL